MTRAHIILLVDDDDEARLVSEEVLRALGCIVHAVTTSRDARIHLDSQRYDLVLTEAKLGDGSGIAIADLAESKGTSVVILTSFGIEMRHELRKYACLFKPIRPDELERAAQQWLSAGNQQ